MKESIMKKEKMWKKKEIERTQKWKMKNERRESTKKDN